MSSLFKGVYLLLEDKDTLGLRPSFIILVEKDYILTPKSQLAWLPCYQPYGTDQAEQKGQGTELKAGCPH